MRQFFKSLHRTPDTLISFLVISVFALSIPGQNDWQTMSLHPGPLKIDPVSVSLPELGPVPMKQSKPSALNLTAASAIALDPQSGTVLFEKDIDRQLLPASTTKIMTSLIALDEYQPDEVVTIRGLESSVGHTANINSGEKLTVEDLLYAMLVNSGNDAAYALAVHHPQGYRHFVDLMNQKAEDLHLKNTRYSNVSGLESWTHYSSARDLALLTQEALKNPLFKEVVATQAITVTTVDGAVSHRLVNLNELLGVVEGVQGVKTGWTPLAGECLVTYTVRDGNPVITVVLNSTDRFGESEELIEWVYQNYSWMAQDKLLQQLES